MNKNKQNHTKEKKETKTPQIIISHNVHTQPPIPSTLNDAN